MAKKLGIDLYTFFLLGESMPTLACVLHQKSPNGIVRKRDRIGEHLPLYLNIHVKGGWMEYVSSTDPTARVGRAI